MTAAQQAEASGKPLAVVYAGNTYEINVEKVTIQAIEDVEEGRIISGVKAILGPVQWSEFKERHSLLTELNDFFLEAMNAINTQGNSSASPVS